MQQHLADLDSVGGALAFLEKLLPNLETRPDLGHLAIEIKKQIDKIRQEIRALQGNQ